MKFTKTKTAASSLTLLLSMFTPLVALVPQASATGMIRVWSGAGAGVEDTTSEYSKTITFDMSDTANWVGGVAPNDTDSWEFPANGAQVDPDSSETDDDNWKYIINNDLQNDSVDGDIVVNGITFTGDPGTDYNVYDDNYNFTGNGIMLDGDIDNQYVDSKGSMTLGFSVMLSADSVVTDVNLGNYDFPDAEIHLGGNNLTLCDATDPARFTQSVNAHLVDLDGDGVITANCAYSSFQQTSGSLSDDAGRSLVVGEKASFAIVSGLLIGSNGDEFSIASSITVKDKGALNIRGYSDTDPIEYDGDITFEGGSYTVVERLSDSGGGGGSGGGGADGSITLTYSDDQYKDFVSSLEVTNYSSSMVKFTLSGTITIAEDIVISAEDPLVISGILTGSGSLLARDGTSGFTVSGENDTDTTSGTTKSKLIVIEVTGTDASQFLYLNSFRKYVLKDNPTVGNVEGTPGSVLSGTGTVGALAMQEGSILSPGFSPGCINSGDLTLAGTFEVEIAGTTVCTEYDQTDVTGAVDVTGGTLDVLDFLDGFVPALNDTFTIIKNDAADKTVGTFTGMAEASTFDVGGVTFRINYNSGEGDNDVVLTAVAVPAEATPEATPGTPDTGVGSLIQNPLVPFLSALLAGGAMLGIRKINSVHK
jgi:hypothetical protein